MAKDKQDALHGNNIRLWVVEGGVHPDHAVIFRALGKINDVSWSKGDATRITAPDPDHFDKEITIGRIPGSPERASVTLAERYMPVRAYLLGLHRLGCRFDAFGLVGKCGNPQDFPNGGEKWIYFRDGLPSTHGIENPGAFGLDETAATNETEDCTFDEYWEFLRMGGAEVGDDVATREIDVIAVCDDISCGECARVSGGCQRVMAVMAGTGATPGTQPVLLYSSDNGTSWSTDTITTMFSTERAADRACIAGDFVLISTQGNEFHYVNVDDLYIGQHTWFQADSGFVAGGEPLAMWSAGPNHTWVVGNGGYIYFTANHRTGVTVQDAGVQTTQNLNCVHAYDKNNVLVVGNSNAVVFTRNGGQTWETLTGPAAGENLGVCWMWDEDVWFIGTGSGGSGVLYKTVDGGYNWTTVTLPVSGTIGQFDKLVFSSEAEGFLAYRAGGNGYILRTITGGNIWWGFPDDNATQIPANDYINDIAVCEKDSNTIFAGGLDDDGSAGIIIKGEPPGTT